jgi:energy-coupling factor transporter transmembrane protein EcfT
MYEIKSSLNEIVVTICNNNVSNKFAIGFIAFFATTILLIPVIVFIILIIQGEGIPFGFVITCIVSISVAFYLFRITFWNVYGKEIITITKNELSIINDYRFFKDRIKTFQFSNINIMYDNGTENNTDESIKSNIYFKLDKTTLVTNIILPISCIEKISENIYDFLNSKV